MRLYKFHPLNQYLFELLLDNTLWCSKPEHFNDPFDLKFKLEIEIPEEEKLRRLNQKWDDIINSGPYFIDKEKVNAEYLPIVNSPEFDSGVRQIVLDAIQELRVCCFSKQYQHILMWSHYASGHKGVCLGFDIESTQNLSLIPVNYSNKYPIVKDVHEARIGLATKSKHWKYEKEVRLINFSGFGKVGFRPDSLKEVIFGAKTDEETIARIKKILKANGYSNIKLKKAEIMNDQYKLTFKQLK